MKPVYSALVFTTFIFLNISCSKSSSGGPTPTSDPEASINNVSQDRSTTTSTFHFTVNLSKASTSDITIHYTTVEGSAKETKDYTPVSGTLNITAGSTSGKIDVDITGDSLRKLNQLFYVQLDNPKNCTLKTSKGTATIVNENNLYLPVSDAGYSTPSSYPGYTLAWSDEFNGNSVNTADWTYETGNNGWGNNELENYTNTTQNSFVSTGNLIIEARHVGDAYSSARMITKNKKIFTYGRIDIRAKLPKGKGIWPALWMLGNNIDAVNWPSCGEIDMMELLGQEPNKVYGTMHWGTSAATHESKGTNYVLSSGDFYDEFHVFSMLWEQDSIKLYVDDHLYFSFSKGDVTGSPYPFNNNFFFIFNVAVGGNWPGNPDGTTDFPQRMFVDYVRVFQK